MTLLPEDFAPTEEMVQKAMAKHGLTRQQVKDKTDRMRLWAESKAERRASWAATWMNFMEPKGWESSGKPKQRAGVDYPVV